MAERRRVVTIILGIIATVAALSVGFVAMQFMSLGGWEPDEHSPYATRMRAIDARLQPGMTRQQVKAIFRADVAANPGDMMLDSSDTLGGTLPVSRIHLNGIGSNEADLTAFEPRRHFWNSFKTAWTVRATFDRNDRLTHHRLAMDASGSPP
jgi:hypothetical protein